MESTRVDCARCGIYLHSRLLVDRECGIRHHQLTEKIGKVWKRFSQLNVSEGLEVSVSSRPTLRFVRVHCHATGILS